MSKVKVSELYFNNTTATMPTNKQTAEKEKERGKENNNV